MVCDMCERSSIPVEAGTPEFDKMLRTRAHNLVLKRKDFCSFNCEMKWEAANG